MSTLYTEKTSTLATPACKRNDTPLIKAPPTTVSLNKTPRPQSPLILKTPSLSLDNTNTSSSTINATTAASSLEANKNGLTIAKQNFYGSLNISKPTVIIKKVPLNNETSSPEIENSLTLLSKSNNNNDTNQSLSSKRRRINSNDNLVDAKKPISKALTSKRTLANNSNFNNKNPRYDQENLENNLKNSFGGAGGSSTAAAPATTTAKGNGSIKTWNRTNSMTKPAGKGYFNTKKQLN